MMGERTLRQELEGAAPHFHVANGPRPGGPFSQDAAWIVRDWVMEHVARTAARAQA